MSAARERLEEVLHPHTGLFRGLRRYDMKGDPGKTIPVKVSELLATRDTLMAVLSGLGSSQPLQERTHAWALDTFGHVALEPHERARRFLEEALELCQTQGVTNEEALGLINYVYTRPVGEAHQEMGGSMITLLLLAEVLGLSAMGEAWREQSRVEEPGMQERMREKHARKVAQGVAA